MQTTLQDRRTLSADEIRTLDEEKREALVIHATIPAAKVRMERHYEGQHSKNYASSVEWSREYRQADQLESA
jgi:type IV secretion system protein VirD4